MAGPVALQRIEHNAIIAISPPVTDVTRTRPSVRQTSSVRVKSEASELHYWSLIGCAEACRPVAHRRNPCVRAVGWGLCSNSAVPKTAKYAFRSSQALIPEHPPSGLIAPSRSEMETDPSVHCENNRNWRNSLEHLNGWPVPAKRPQPSTRIPRISPHLDSSASGTVHDDDRLHGQGDGDPNLTWNRSLLYI